MSREHQVLDSREDTGIADLFALARPVEVYAAVDYRGHLLSIPQHLCRIIVHFLHAAGHSGSAAQALQPCSQHRFCETSFDLSISNKHKLQWLCIGSSSGPRLSIEVVTYF